MKENLINSGIIDPQALSREDLKPQVVQYLGIEPNRLEKLKLWKNKILVSISGVGGRFISYRCCGVWYEAIRIAIENCQNREQLLYIGDLLHKEVERFGHHYDDGALEELRQVWHERAQYIKAEEKRLKAIRERKQVGQKWQDGWVQVLINCDSFQALQSLAREIERQSRKFDDLPEISQGMARIWQQRWQELSMSSA